MADPMRHKQTLIEINNTMRLNSYLPSEKLLNCFLFCCIKWKDIEKCFDMFKELKDNNLAVTLTCYEHLLGLLAISSEKRMIDKGLEVWNEFKNQQPRKRPSRGMYIRLFELLGKSKDEDGLIAHYHEAVDDVERLHREHAIAKDKLFGVDTRIKFLNAYMSALLELKSTDLALGAFQSFLKSSDYLSKAVGLSVLKNTFRILFKISSLKNDYELGQHFYNLAYECSVDLDYMMFGRLIAISNDPVELLQSAMIRLQPLPGSKQFMSLHESAIQSLCINNPDEAFKYFEKIKQKGKDELKMLRITYYNLLDCLTGNELRSVRESFIKDYGECEDVPRKYFQLSFPLGDDLKKL
jgi:pentatricopeptide repeat protein